MSDDAATPLGDRMIDRRQLLAIAGIGVGLAAIGSVLPGTRARAATTFVHPGIAHTAADLTRMAAKAGTAPWSDGLAALRAASTASASYAAAPVSNVDTVADSNVIRSDSEAAYFNAVLWAVFGETDHRDAAIRIIAAWTGTLTAFSTEYRLPGAIATSNFANAGELLRHTGSGWSDSAFSALVSMLRDTIYPAFAWNQYADGNQGNSSLVAIQALGILSDDTELFDFVTTSLQNNTCSATGSSSGIQGYILASGEIAEMGRDQTHALGGYNGLAQAAEVAYTQGVDLFSFAGHRLLAGFEYFAQYNLGYDVDYVPFGPCSVTFNQISATGRGLFDWAPAELIWNAYRNRQHNADGTYWTGLYRDAIAPSAFTFFYRR